MNQPFFSIIVPTYNRADFLQNTINSVLNQTFTNWELIIIDDGSTDNTKEVISMFNDTRIKYFYQENAERSVARNNGIQNSLGEWICFLDSDDEYLDNHLLAFFNYIKTNDFTGMLISGSIVQHGDITKKHKLLEVTSDNILKEIWTKFILMNSVCVKKQILLMDNFNPKYRIWEDTHLWLRIASKHSIIQLNNYSCKQNVHENSSVLEGFNSVKIKEVSQYIEAITDLENNAEIKKHLTANDFINYKDSKFRMYLYQARKNKQLSVSLKLWWRAVKNKRSSYMLIEVVKIFLNQFGIGTHG